MNDNAVTITFKNFVNDKLCLLSHHDITLGGDISNKIVEFTEKYKRRHDRLINLIETNEKICFIHHHNNSNKVFDYDDCIEFNKIIKSINKNSNCFLVLLMNDAYGEDYKYEKTEYFIKINLKHFILTDPKKDDWTLSHYDWETIFKFIKDVTGEPII
jgi:hypothetical protein